MSHPGGPLAGIRVLDAAGMIAGPSTAALMADFGADVIKLEPPQGDLLRGMIGVEDGPDPWWQLDNRGKRGVAIDLTTDEGIEAAHAIAATCDVFLTNLTAERQARYRLRPEDLRAEHPELIHATITGYGSSGPDQDRLAFDHTAFFARGGVLDIMGEPGAPPTGRAGQGDHTTSLALLSTILLALRERDLTGEGQVVEVALMQIALWTLASDISVGLATGEMPGPRLRIEMPGPLVTRYRCADDRWINFCMPGGDYWPKFCNTLGHPEWATDERFATPELRIENAPELITMCDEIFATADRDTWAQRCDAAGLIWGAIHDLTEVVDDPQAAELGAFSDVDGLDRPFRTVSAPLHLTGSEHGVRGRAPDHGEHTAAVLAEAGLSEDQIADLLARGVVITDGLD